MLHAHRPARVGVSPPCGRRRRWAMAWSAPPPAAGALRGRAGGGGRGRRAPPGGVDGGASPRPTPDRPAAADGRRRRWLAAGGRRRRGGGGTAAGSCARRGRPSGAPVPAWATPLRGGDAAVGRAAPRRRRGGGRCGGRVAVPWDGGGALTGAASPPAAQSFLVSVVYLLLAVDDAAAAATLHVAGGWRRPQCGMVSKRPWRRLWSRACHRWGGPPFPCGRRVRRAVAGAPAGQAARRPPVRQTQRRPQSWTSCWRTLRMHGHAPGAEVCRKRQKSRSTLSRGMRWRAWCTPLHRSGAAGEGALVG